MIGFFRKVRKQLADDNKPLKYMRYASGEIVLVVIGILIALQVNNWNEIKKNEQTIILALKEIQVNLLEDIDAAQNDVDDYLRTDSIKRKIFDFCVL